MLHQVVHVHGRLGADDIWRVGYEAAISGLLSLIFWPLSNNVAESSNRIFLNVRHLYDICCLLTICGRDLFLIIQDLAAFQLLCALSHVCRLLCAAITGRYTG